MAAQETIGGWGFLVALVIGPGIVAAFLWSPFLLAARLRRLFQSLPPARSAAVSYLVVTIGLSMPYVLGTGIAITESHDGTGGAMANAILDVLLPVTGLYVVGLPIVAAVVLPHLGIDWDPAEYAPATWLLLVIASAWYAALFAVPLFLFAAVLAFPA